jgi:ABC-type dipeptide/oligopeptide/nickel transport system permease component
MALLSITLSVIFLLALAMPTWVAALIVALVWGGVAAVLGMRGRDRIRQAGPPVPEQTIDSVKEDVQWLKNRK